MHDLAGTIAGLARRLPGATPSLVRRLCLASLVSVGVIVLTGAAVRVTGSGLGCTDWPTCSTGHITPPLQFHSLMEFGNRMVTVLLVVLVGATFLATLQRRPFRRDLAWLGGSLVAGILVEAVIGGIVVYSKLNPYLVIVHFLATMLLLADAAVLFSRSGRDYSPGSGRLLVARPLLLLSRGMVVMVGVVIAAGSATTGAAPDGGGAQGQEIAKRIPVALREMAELHSTLALFLIGLVLALAVALHAVDVPERVRKAARMLVVVLVCQAVVGYAQYFTHLPAALVELHELGATVLVVGAVLYYMALTHHSHERATVATQREGALCIPAYGTPAGVGGSPAGMGSPAAPGRRGVSVSRADGSPRLGSWRARRPW